MISFHYNQQKNTNEKIFNTISSHHIINTARILKFTYQNVQPLPKYERIEAYPSASCQLSALPLSSRPQQSIRASKGINITTSKRTKDKVNKNVLPKSLSTEQQEESASNKQRKMSQSNHEGKVGNPNINPQSIYTYILPSHISLQSNNKPNCELFSICKEPNEQEHNEFKETNIKTGKTNTISHQVKEREPKSAARQKIFQPQKISQFNIQDAAEHIKEPQMVRIQEENILDRIKLASRPSGNSSSNRKRLFSEIIVPKQKKYTILEEQVDMQDIPLGIIQEWQKFEHQIQEWSPSIQPKQIASRQTQAFQNL